MTCITCRAAGRFRGNACAAREHGLSVDSVLAQCPGVDMHDDFERRTTYAGNRVPQRLLRDNTQRIGTSLRGR